ncbi:MAG: DOMON domain-containing protein [Dictyoglomus thermophilum]|uniref:DOMON domain-containing protein n=1 Tax=Dictyoglomus thermophilum TaxID=14 RepID=UPI001654654D|nr:DOMON domain-containing protein [Dictyoglomus thermophilum]MCX7720409.1 DOMON domain-containing protein [Dictyoglomus thermophilum]
MRKALILAITLFLLTFAFAQTLKPKIDGKLSPNEYPHYASFSNGDFQIYWKIEGDEVYILMIGKTKGYVALGINPTVKAGDADYIIGYVTDKGAQVLDYYAPEKHMGHTLDEKLGGKNDILELAGTEDKEYTYIEFRRKLDTKDKYDKVFPKTGTLKIVWALGNSDDPNSMHVKRGYGELKIN